MSDRHHWHRTTDHGIPVQFAATIDERGNATLTIQELEGLMRTGCWKPGPIPVRKAFVEHTLRYYRQTFKEAR